jgi:hypothetical protein
VTDTTPRLLLSLKSRRSVLGAAGNNTKVPCASLLEKIERSQWKTVSIVGAESGRGNPLKRQRSEC